MPSSSDVSPDDEGVSLLRGRRSTTRATRSNEVRRRRYEIAALLGLYAAIIYFCRATPDAPRDAAPLFEAPPPALAVPPLHAQLLAETAAKRTVPFEDGARLVEAIPRFESSDADIDAAYWYRWRVVLEHLRRDVNVGGGRAGDKSYDYGWALSEFLPHVNWQGPSGTINCAYGHHSAEARWLRAPEILDNYSSFWYRHPKVDIRYTWWPAHAAYERALLDGRVDDTVRVLWPHLRAGYRKFVDRSLAMTPGGAPCVWQAAHDEGQENSVGLDGCRPLTNSAMYAEARALERIARWLGDADAAAAYAEDATKWKTAVRALWHPELKFFVTRTLKPPAGRADDIKRGRTKVGCLMCTKRRQTHCPPEWKDGELVDVRELAGLSSPWYFGAADDARYAEAFAQLTADGGFGAKWGLRTAERRHSCYNFSTNCVTSWHAPVWPFESSKLLTGLARALAGPHAAAAARHGATPAAFADHLRTYARMHTRGAAEDVAAGVPFVGESFHPDDGFWLTRRLMFQRKMHEEKRRGDHYFHSTYVDNVLSGLVGLRVELDDAADITSARLVVQPLFAADQFAYVAATRVLVRGRDVAVAWDRDGSRYGGRAGLSVWVDGRAAAHSPEPRRLEVPLRSQG